MPERIGRYMVFPPIASGGMATVHLSRLMGPLGFRRTLAAKKLRKEIANPELALMLVDEARLGARVQHPNVVQIVDVVSEGDEVVVFMEHVLGESLAKLAQRARKLERPIDLSIAVAVVVGALRGLHAAHEATDEDGTPLGIVHRDISPQNVLVGIDGVARVADFGVAKALGRMQTTSHGQIKGKLSYMAPEQMRGELVDRRTDLFASGIVLWELLTGQRLFGNEDEKTTIGRVLTANIARPSSLRSDIGEALDEVALRALARDADERFATAFEFAEALTQVCRLASPTEVGAWVESLCGEELTVRRKAITDIEREVHREPGGETVPVSPEDATDAAMEATAGADHRVQSTTPERAGLEAGSTRRFGVPAAVVALVAMLVVVAFYARSSLMPRSAAQASAAGMSGALDQSTPQATSPPSAVVLIPATPTSATHAASVFVSPSPSSVATARLFPSTARPKTQDCTNPYYLDADGRKRYRRECLQ